MRWGCPGSGRGAWLGVEVWLGGIWCVWGREWAGLGQDTAGSGQGQGVAGMGVVLSGCGWEWGRAGSRPRTRAPGWPACWFGIRTEEAGGPEPLSSVGTGMVGLLFPQGPYPVFALPFLFSPSPFPAPCSWFCGDLFKPQTLPTVC